MSQKAFANVEDAVEYLFGSNISETMLLFLPMLMNSRIKTKLMKKT